MKKLLTPIIYLSFLLPLTGISIGIEMLARESGLLGEWKNVIDMPLILMFSVTILVFGIPIFWLSNLLLQKIEKQINLSIYDHLRQSFFFYLIAIYSLISWITNGFTGSEDDAYLLLWLGISFTGIVINYIFLFKKRKKNHINIS